MRSLFDSLVGICLFLRWVSETKNGKVEEQKQVLTYIICLVLYKSVAVTLPQK